MNKKYLLVLYDILFKYLEYRKKPVPNKLSNEKFVENMTLNSMVIIESGDICIILTLPGGKFAILGADGKKKLKDIAQTSKYKEIMYICDINYVALKTATSLNSVKKTTTELKSMFKDIWFQIRSYKNFELDISKSSEIVPHRIMNDEEVEKYLKSEYKTKSSQPVIYEFDPPAVWNGVRAGMYVEIERGSVSVLMQQVVRYCVEPY